MSMVRKERIQEREKVRQSARRGEKTAMAHDNQHQGPGLKPKLASHPKNTTDEDQDLHPSQRPSSHKSSNPPTPPTPPSPPVHLQDAARPSVPASQSPTSPTPHTPKVRLFLCLGCIAEPCRQWAVPRYLIDQITMNVFAKTVTFIAKGPKAWYRRDARLDNLDSYSFNYVVRKDVVPAVLNKDEKDDGWVAIEAQAF
ncbi:hypothetical protein B0T18DRAFT_388574 [Schizothecium vesticola]|uniref:Uncharacterized protein n=1 Tax=Schizothecium vesticola TaxID=314040 RepID=A0AA40KB62_9PEZI|nr:hypothetical protein B0T18DRAFT_388574 [Schizothecium vesticola]